MYAENPAFELGIIPRTAGKDPYLELPVESEWEQGTDSVRERLINTARPFGKALFSSPLSFIAGHESQPSC